MDGNLRAGILTHQLVEEALALPPADFDQRTLDAVDRVLADRVAKSGFRETARTLNLAREAIRRELGGAR